MYSVAGKAFACGLRVYTVTIIDYEPNLIVKTVPTDLAYHDLSAD